MRDMFLGLDIGTSGVKAVLVKSSGELAGYSGVEYDFQIPHPGWAEQDPQTWICSAGEAIRSLLSKTGVVSSQIAGIGLAGQMHSLVCLGEHGQVIRPAILWADQRARMETLQIQADLGKEQLAEWTGNPLPVGFPPGTWLWLKKHEPTLFRQIRLLLQPKDYVRFRMTGNVGTDPSDASATGLYDPFGKKWSAGMLSYLQMDEASLPGIHPSAEIAGVLTAEACDWCGLEPGIPIIYGGSDQAMQAVGQGILLPGSCSITIGTGGQIFTPLTAPLHDPGLRFHLFCHVLPERWHIEAAILTAGLAFRWLRNQFGANIPYGDLAEEASGVKAAEEGLFFVPHLAGERTPWMDSDAAAAFVGLRLHHTRAHLARAVMEGVVFALREACVCVEEGCGPMKEFLVCGGATRHPLWMYLLADSLGRPVRPSITSEATGLGAALLAALGTGAFQNEEQLCQCLTSPENLIFPEREAEMDRAYHQYARIYPALALLRE